jgi:hypothetical protein
VSHFESTATDYGVPEDQILGIRYGLRGFYERDDKPVTLTRRAVDGIHLKGGTVLVRVWCCVGVSGVGASGGGVPVAVVWLPARAHKLTLI